MQTRNDSYVVRSPAIVHRFVWLFIAIQLTGCSANQRTHRGAVDVAPAQPTVASNAVVAAAHIPPTESLSDPQIAFSPDGKQLAVAGRRAVAIYETATGNLVHFGEIPAESSERAANVAFSPAKGVIITIHEPYNSTEWQVRIRAWPIRSSEKELKPVLLLENRDDNCLTPICQVSFSADGQLVAAGDPSGFVHVWRTSTHQELGKIEGGLAAFFVDDRSRLVGVNLDGTCRPIEVDADSSLQAGPLEPVADYIYALYCSHSRKRSQIALSDGHSVIVRDIGTNKAMARRVFQRRLQSIEFLEDGMTLAIVDGDDSMILWDITHDTDRVLAKAFLGAVTFSPTGDRVAHCAKDGIHFTNLASISFRNRSGDAFDRVTGAASPVSLEAKIILRTGQHLVDRIDTSKNQPADFWGSSHPDRSELNLTVRIRNTGNKTVVISALDSLQTTISGPGALNVPKFRYQTGHRERHRQFELEPDQGIDLQMSQFHSARAHWYWVLPGEYLVWAILDLEVKSPDSTNTDAQTGILLLAVPTKVRVVAAK